MTDAVNAELAALRAELAATKEGLRELQDIHEINDVFFKWHHDCTGGFNGKQGGRMEALECLTDDATIEIKSLHQPGQGPKGRKQYTEFWDFYYGDAGPLPYVFQNSVSEKVVVTGDTAVQYSNMLVVQQPRGAPASISVTQRTNNFVRTPQGWRINKTTVDGGYNTTVNDLKAIGTLNELPPAEARTPWSYKG